MSWNWACCHDFEFTGQGLADVAIAYTGAFIAIQLVDDLEWCSNLQ